MLNLQWAVVCADVWSKPKFEFSLDSDLFRGGCDCQNVGETNTIVVERFLPKLHM